MQNQQPRPDPIARRHYKRSDFDTAMVMAVVTPVCYSRPACEKAAELIAEHDPEILVIALMERLQAVRKDLEEFRRYGIQKEVEARRRAELSVIPTRGKRA